MFIQAAARYDATDRPIYRPLPRRGLSLCLSAPFTIYSPGKNRVTTHRILHDKGGNVTPKDVLAYCREKGVKAVDLRFMDFPGLWQHFTIPVNKLDESVFEEGLGFDGSSIRGWQAINESDMLVVPQADTAFLDPFTDIPTLVMICNIQDPLTGEDYSRDPRNVARKAVNYLKSTGVADTCFIGPEAEFFVFDDIRFDQRSNCGFYFIDAMKGNGIAGPITVHKAAVRT